MKTITKIILPNKPHLDLIVAYWLLLNYGQEKYPALNQVPLAVWKSGGSPDPATLKQWQDENIISLDIEGGTYDHHGQSNCLTLIVARDLNITERPELQSLIRYIQEDDAAGLHNNFGELAGIVKALYAQGETQETVIKLTLQLIDALQNKEKSWHVDAKKEYEDKAQLFKIKRHKNKIKLAVVKTDDIHVSNYAQKADAVAVVIQQNSLGHVFIFTNNLFRLNITAIVGVIRLREAELNQQKVNYADLKKPGKIAGVQNWFYHESLNAMMNGSEALTNTIPTKLSLSEIVTIVVFGLTLPNTPPEEPENLERYHYYQNLFNQIK